MEYVDLGLPSGTKWASKNEEGYYKYKEAVEKYGNALPTKEQFEELKDNCQWEWMCGGYKVTGPNGKSIFLPAEGCRNCNDSVTNVGSNGYYWSSTPYGPYSALKLFFVSIGMNVYDDDRCYGNSVRLVKNTKDNF